MEEPKSPTSFSLPAIFAVPSTSLVVHLGRSFIADHLATSFIKVSLHAEVLVNFNA